VDRSPFIVDVVVIGSGVAGTAAAVSCRQLGLKTLLIEPSPDATNIPGETLHPGVMPLLQALGIDKQVNASGYHRHTGYIVRTGTTATVHEYGTELSGSWLGYQIVRSDLLAIMRARAERVGTIILRGARALAPIIDDGRVTGVISTEGPCISKAVIDASGQATWLMRQFRLPVLQISPRLIASYGWTRCRSSRWSSRDSLPEFVIHEAGWKWTARITERRRAWVHLDLKALPQNPSCRAPTNQIKALISPQSMERSGARNVSWRIARPCAGPGYFLVGDAAWILDPASSHGVLFAMMSGMAAARTIKNALSSSANESLGIADYSTWTERWFCRDASALISLYSANWDLDWLAAASEAIRYIEMSPSERIFSRSIE
jgi:flavin-dependent dehydrogenase